MTDINLGNKIREFRKKKGITQEALAAVLSVSPQAVSKWESNLTYPDMATVPAIARYFGVSLDTLFDYNVAEIQEKVDKIKEEAAKYFNSDPKRYAQTMKDALKIYPNHEDLLYGLVNVYSCFDPEIDGDDYFGDMLESANQLFAECTDYMTICWTKLRLAQAYQKRGEYDKAKELFEALPNFCDIPTKCKMTAFTLTGKDGLNAAENYRCEHLQELYIACQKEGDAWYSMDQYPNVTFRYYTPADYLPKAIERYNKGLSVIELFMVQENEGEARYLWPGMQTFHYIFCQRIAACYKRLGQLDECEKMIDKAYHIVSTSWNDFEEHKDEIMAPFYKYLREYDLAEYVR